MSTALNIAGALIIAVFYVLLIVLVAHVIGHNHDNAED